MSKINNSMISAVVVTFNCASFIDACLQSLQWVDEIVIVDLGSTDDTLRICAKYGARIERHPWVPHGNPVRNFGAAKASGDWVLHMDPDERITPKLARLLRLIADHSDVELCGGVNIPRLNIAFDRAMHYGGWWPDWQLRFGRKDHLFFPEAVHGTGQIRNGKPILSLDPNTEIALTHLAVPNLGRLIERLGRYAEDHAKQAFQEGHRFTLGGMIADPIYKFYKHFVELQGYRDGVPGLVLTLAWHFIYPLMIHLHLWELSGRPGTSSVEHPERLSWQLALSTLRLRQVRDVVAYILRREVTGAEEVLIAAVTVRNWIRNRSGHST